MEHVSRSHSSRRWLGLAVSILIPLVLVGAILLSGERAQAGPLSPAATISGVVVKPDGGPLTTTTNVCLKHLAPGETWEDWHDCRETDLAGHFVFTGDIPIGSLFVRADAPWDSPYFPSLPKPLLLNAPTGNINVGPVTLTYASFAGVVYEPDGRTPADGGHVALYGMGWEEVAGRGYDATGYAVGGAPAGRFMLVAHPPEHTLFWDSEPLAVTVTPGSQYDPLAVQEIDLELTLAPLAVYVTDPGRVPVTASVHVWNYDSGYDLWREATPGSPATFGDLEEGETYWMEAWPTWEYIPDLANSPRETIVIRPTPVSRTLTLQLPNVFGAVETPEGDPLPPARDADGNPVTAASVSVHNMTETFQIEALTTPEGEFSLALPPGDYRLWAFPYERLSFTYTRSTAVIFSIPGTLQTPAYVPLTYPSVKGRVLDPGGNPLPGCVDVWLEAPDGDRAAAEWYCGGQERPYHLGGVGAGDYALKVDSLPDLGLFAPPPIPIHVAPGSQYIFTATQVRNIRMTGPQLDVFVRYAGGGPAPAHVVLKNEQFWEQRFTPDGVAHFGALTPGEYWIEAWPAEHDIPAWANSVRELVFIGEDFISRTLELRPPDLIGRVTTPEGNPLPQAFDCYGNPVPHPAEVNVHSPNWGVDLWATTNISGQFSLALPPGEYELVAHPLDSLEHIYTKSALRRFPLGNEPRPKNLGDIPLTYPRIRGVVVDPDGERVSTGVSLWGFSANAGEYWDWDETFWYGPDSPENKPFSFGGMPAGHYFVQAEPPWNNPEGYGKSNVHEFDVPPLSGADFITLHLTVANVRGWVRFPDERPVPWVSVALHTPDWTFEDWAQTDEAGQFVFSGLQPGGYILDVFLGDDLLTLWNPPPPMPITLTTPTERIERTLYLERAIRNKHVLGRVVDQHGAPVDNALVFAHHAHTGRYVDDPTDANGEYHFAVEGGLWKVEVKPLDPSAEWFFDPADAQWVAFPPDVTVMTKTVNFTVTRFMPGQSFKVAGRVEDPAGNPPPPDSTFVDLCSDNGRCFGAPVAPGGRFTVTVLPGPYRLWVNVDPATGLLPPAGNGFPLFVGRDLDVGVLHLRSQADRTARVSGRVIISPTGRAMAGVKIEAWTDDGDWNETQTNNNGEYTLNLLPGYWHGGPRLTPEQERDYFVLPPQERSGYLAANEVISGVNFFVRYRDAAIQGFLVNQNGEPVTDTTAVVYAEFCPPGVGAGRAPAEANTPERRCLIVADSKTADGRFQLRVIGGLTYTVGVWPQEPGYMPGDPARVHVGVGQVITGVQVTLLEAGTRIWGVIHDSNTGEELKLPARVFGSDGLHWVEDNLWPEKEPYQYNLYVPTPVDNPVTWTLGVWVDPRSGYVADLTRYAVAVGPGDTSEYRVLYAHKLETVITGVVGIAADGVFTPKPHVIVFADGIPGSPSAGRHFEAESDELGKFLIPVLPGQYKVSAYLPPDMQTDFFPPLPEVWDDPSDNPVTLRFRPKPTAAVQICGGLLVSPTEALAEGTAVHVFGWGEDGSRADVTGTIGFRPGNGYCMDVISNTVWHVWAAYEDRVNGLFYTSREEIVRVGSHSEFGVLLTLEQSPNPLPPPICESVDPAVFKRISLPAMGDLPEPLVEIQAGTFPVTGTVRVCARPVVALPDGSRMIGFAYELEAYDSAGNLITADFNKKVRLIFYFNAAALGETDPHDLIVAFYSTTRGEWTALEDVFVDVEDLFATGKTSHFSRFGVFAPPQVSGQGTIELSSVEITGPNIGVVNVVYTFVATASPITATGALPITYTWAATGQAPAVHVLSALSDTVAYTWSDAGVKTIVVTATNGVSVVSDTHSIEIGYRIYLPLTLRNT